MPQGVQAIILRRDYGLAFVVSDQLAVIVLDLDGDPGRNLGGMKAAL